MNKPIKFLGEFFRNAGRTGSVTPSSPALIRQMVKPVDFRQAKLIIELGPGTGPITKSILKHMRKDATLLVFETNSAFCADLEKIKDKRMRVINDSAEKIQHYLDEYNLDKADCVISSIPLTVLPVKIRMRILSEAKSVLKPGGVFTQFHYSRVNEKVLRKFFPNLRISFTPLNIPPAFVYTGKVGASRA